MQSSAPAVYIGPAFMFLPLIEVVFQHHSLVLLHCIPASLPQARF